MWKQTMKITIFLETQSFVTVSISQKRLEIRVVQYHSDQRDKCKYAAQKYDIQVFNHNHF